MTPRGASRHPNGRASGGRKGVTAAGAWVLGLGLSAGAHAGSAETSQGAFGRGYCERPVQLSVSDEDRLLRLATLVRDELAASDDRVALVSRSGLDLERFGIRYSHSGISLRDSANAPWSVRQLYYACDEQRPRVFDQGLSGYVIGMDNPELGYLSVVLLPPEAADRLERAALDNRQVLSVLNPRYSANAYAWGVEAQNCNQWLAEMLALAWGRVEPGSVTQVRRSAQAWLNQAGYQAAELSANPLVRLATAFIPWVHSDDHPERNLSEGVYQVHMPQSIEAFVRRQWPQSRRIEFCRAGDRVVIHEGWDAVGRGCTPGPGDRIVTLE